MLNPCNIRTMMFLGEEKIRGYETSYFQVNDSERRVHFGFVWDGRIEYGFFMLLDAKREFQRRATEGAADNWQEEIDNVV